MDIVAVIILLFKILFFAVVLIATFFSLFGIYLFIRHGENRGFTLAVSAIYTAGFLILVSVALTTLSQL